MALPTNRSPSDFLPPSRQPDQDGESPWASVVGLINAILRRRGWLIGVVAVAMLLGLWKALTTDPTFTSVSTFMPELPRQGSSPISGIAAQFGLSIPSSDGANSPLFYPDLVRSPQFLGKIAEASYQPTPSERARSVGQVLVADVAEPRMLRVRAVEELQRMVAANAAPRTGVVTLTVTTGDPRLSQLIANEILQEINRINISRRQTRAGAERRFVEQRVQEVRADLRAAEDRLQRFLDENRDFTKSANLQFAHARLEREVMLQQQLFATLSQSYEQAKIEEVRDTPQISVLGAPEVPVRANPRGRLRMLTTALIGGLLLGAVLSFLVDVLRTSKGTLGREPQLAEFSHLAHELREDIQRGRLLKAFFGGKPTRHASEGHTHGQTRA